jgi:hypothetical protein
VTERSAETGEHYITRDRDEYRHMLGMALGGGGIIGFTTLIKFAITALALPVFWNGLGAGLNYALSFVIVQLLHWTVATKQPAMTAPSMARKLEGIASDVALGRFVDEVAHLLRSQMAGIIGNLVAVAPVVLALQGLSWWLAGKPLIGQAQATTCCTAPPCWAHRAVRGLHRRAAVRLQPDRRLGRELVRLPPAGQRHRLEPALHRLAGREPGPALGPLVARQHLRPGGQCLAGPDAGPGAGAGLGLRPAAGGAPRHPVHRPDRRRPGHAGPALLHEPAFWWCVAAIPVTAMLNLGVSFALAFRLAMVSQGLKLQDRGRIYQALRQRWRTAPGSFFFPPRG